MKYRAKEIDGEWLVVDENEDIVAEVADRRDAITMANAMTRESSNADSKPNIHRGSSYGNKPEAELDEGVSDTIDDLEEKTSESKEINIVTKDLLQASEILSKYQSQISLKVVGRNKFKLILNDLNLIDKDPNVSKLFSSTKLTEYTIDDLEEKTSESKEINITTKDLLQASEILSKYQSQISLKVVGRNKFKLILNDLNLIDKDPNVSKLFSSTKLTEYTIDDLDKLSEAAPRITPDEAKSILAELEYSGDSKDFFTLRSSEVSKLLDHAKRLKYRKSSSAPGSTARMFYQYLTRLANKSGSSENIQEAYDKLTDKQLQDKFVSLKVKSKDLSKDSKDSKELQKIRDEIAKRKNLKKESVESQEVLIAESMINILFGNIK